MFRVSISSDLPVFASKVFSSSAQARLGASASSVPELTHSVPNSTPAPCRSSRRLSPGVASPPTRMGCVNMVVSSLRKCSARRSASRVVTVTLQYLDLVSVWVLHEEEACDEPVAVAELLDVVGSQSQRLDARVLAREVIHAHGDVSNSRCRGCTARCVPCSRSTQARNRSRDCADRRAKTRGNPGGSTSRGRTRRGRNAWTGPGRGRGSWRGSFSPQQPPNYAKEGNSMH